MKHKTTNGTVTSTSAGHFLAQGGEDTEEEEMPALCSGILGGLTIWQLVLLAYTQLLVRVHGERLISITTKSPDKQPLKVCRCPFFQAFNSVGAKQHVPLWPLRPAPACQSGLRFYLFSRSLWMPLLSSGSRLSMTLNPFLGWQSSLQNCRRTRQALAGTGHWWLAWSPAHPTIYSAQ
jgi:hypothetical protein